MKKLYIIYVLIVTEGLSLIGSRMSSIAISIWLYQTKGNVTYLLLIPLFNELPPIILGNLSGTFVDRFKRKYIMILGDSGQAICSLILWIIVMTHSFQVWHLYIVVAVQGTFSMLQNLAADASTTLLVPLEHRDRINAIKEMTFPAAGVIAPGFAGFLYTLSGLQGVILFDLITFVISIIVLIAVSIPDPPKINDLLYSSNTFIDDTVSGFKYLLKKRDLLQLILYFSFINFLLNGPLELVIPYIMESTKNETFVSLILIIMNLGALLGAFIITIIGNIHNKVQSLITAMFISGIMFVLFGIARTPLTLGLSLLVLMIPLPISNALFKSVIQSKTQPELQGRVFSIVSQFANIGSTTSFLITGPIVERVIKPIINRSNLSLFNNSFINKPGIEIGLLLCITGLVILTVTAFAYIKPEIRNIG